MDKAYAFVHIIDISYTIDRAYTYFVPPEYREEIKIGSVIVVPFGISNKKKSAVVVRLSDECDYPNIKSMDKILEYPFDVPEDLVSTCGFMKKRFFCTFGAAFRAVLPPGINLDTETVYRISENADFETLNTPAQVLMRDIKLRKVAVERELIDKYGEECQRLLNSLTKAGDLVKFSRVPEKINELNRYTVSLAIEPETALSLLESEKALTKKQKTLVEILLNYPVCTLNEVKLMGNVSPSVVNALVKKKYVSKTETKINRVAYDFGSYGHEKPFTLTDSQEKAVNKLVSLASEDKANAALLFGVTGSGKTRVIIETVKKVIADGKQAIVLLPEIGLASQAVEIYAKAFGKRMTVIHSMLSSGERTDAYRNIISGKIDVVIGTRSAIFSPFKNLGIIVIDEEQSSSYKSEITPKYHATDIARFRCAKSKALMVLASATPSIESFYKAKKGIYHLVKLDRRYNGVLPEVIIEDMRDDPTLSAENLIGQRLSSEIKKAKENGRQSILFVNRRGYNSHISCRDCGKVFQCPNCSVALTYHAYSGFGKSSKRLFCHYCGYTCAVPKQCDACGGTHIGYFGYGTQKLQDELERDFPDITATRMDSDTTAAKFAHDRIIADFSEGKTDLLFGTQMISKGFDFPNVSLVGAVSVDNSLYMNDFRAGERTFSLITQLVGRAGRSNEKGLAILQTYNPENEILQLAKKQDYEKFFESEIVLRRSVIFPPFCSIAVFTVTSSDEDECSSFARKLDVELISLYDKKYNDIKVIRFGPFPESIYRISGKFRQKIIIKYKDESRTRNFLSDLYITGQKMLTKGIRLDLDANPSII